MPNLSGLAPLTTAAQALSNLVLVTPQTTQGYQPQNAPNTDGTPSLRQQPPALLFHYEGDNVVMLQSDITDNYVEDNSAVQDQIALQPEEVTVQGFIGELNDIAPRGLSPVKSIADKLTTIGAYTPELTETALIAYQQAFFLYQVGLRTVEAAVSAWSSIPGVGDGQAVVGPDGLVAATGIQNKQQTAFQQFYGYWRSRTLFNVQTPWAVFQNMAIKTLKAVQDAETRVISSFEITFKSIRNASTVTAFGLPAVFQGRSQSQAAPETNVGTYAPVEGESLSSGLSTMGVA